MLRRSHKKSRAGCLECKRRHVKVDSKLSFFKPSIVVLTRLLELVR
jgi:hypothetical protein